LALLCWRFPLLTFSLLAFSFTCLALLALYLPFLLLDTEITCLFSAPFFDWLVVLYSPSQTDVVYIDFSKAFDSVFHLKLLFKLKLYGIGGLLLRWIEIFLSYRTQCVVTDIVSHLFAMSLVAFLRAQFLGPILFLIYINDLHSVCCGKTRLQLFADDA
jgi:hypothetical protein